MVACEAGVKRTGERSERRLDRESFPFSLSHFSPLPAPPLVCACREGYHNFVDEVLRCYNSNETSSVVLSHGPIQLVCNSNS